MIKEFAYVSHEGQSKLMLLQIRMFNFKSVIIPNNKGKETQSINKSMNNVQSGFFRQ